jgi:hypothetical protein
MRPSDEFLPNDEKSGIREGFVQTFWKFGRHRCEKIPRNDLERLQEPVPDPCRLHDDQCAKEELVCLEMPFVCLQMPASDRCQYQRYLSKLQHDQPAREKLDGLLIGQPS